MKGGDASPPLTGILDQIKIMEDPAASRIAVACSCRLADRLDGYRAGSNGLLPRTRAPRGGVSRRWHRLPTFRSLPPLPALGCAVGEVAVAMGGSRPRFFCDTLGCPRRIFMTRAEMLAPWARQPERWRQALFAWGAGQQR